jgi:hypothetical protein
MALHTVVLVLVFYILPFAMLKREQEEKVYVALVVDHLFGG